MNTRQIWEKENSRLCQWMLKIAQCEELKLCQFAASRAVSKISQVTDKQEGLWPTDKVWAEMVRAVEKG